MWDKLFKAVLDPIAVDNPQMVEAAIQIDSGFYDWAKFHNPNDISTPHETDEIIVQSLAEDLRDLKLRAWYYGYKAKKVKDDEEGVICNYFSHLCDNQFWMLLHVRYKLWNVEQLCIRDGWQIVRLKDRGVPPIIQAILGGGH